MNANNSVRVTVLELEKNVIDAVLDAPIVPKSTDPHAEQVRELTSRGFVILDYHEDCQVGVYQGWIRGFVGENSRQRMTVSHPDLKGGQINCFQVVFIGLSESLCQVKKGGGCGGNDKSARMVPLPGTRVAYLK